MKDTLSTLSHGDVGAMGATNYTFYRHNRDFFMLNMFIVPESAFPYY